MLGCSFTGRRIPLLKRALGEFAVAWSVFIELMRFVKDNEEFPVLNSEYRIRVGSGCNSLRNNQKNHGYRVSSLLSVFSSKSKEI